MTPERGRYSRQNRHTPIFDVLTGKTLPKTRFRGRFRGFGPFWGHFEVILGSVLGSILGPDLRVPERDPHWSRRASPGDTRGLPSWRVLGFCLIFWELTSLPVLSSNPSSGLPERRRNFGWASEFHGSGVWIWLGDQVDFGGPILGSI